MNKKLGTYRCRPQKAYQGYAQNHIGRVPVWPIVTTPAAQYFSDSKASSEMDLCAKDLSCFDQIYSCDICCSTGQNSAGLPCWTGKFNPAMCCAVANSNAVSLFAMERPTADQTFVKKESVKPLLQSTSGGLSIAECCIIFPPPAIQRTKSQTDGQTDGWMDRSTDRMAGGRTDGQMDA